jgi:diketogulonate reductase-like aldo/keto reductase
MPWLVIELSILSATKIMPGTKGYEEATAGIEESMKKLNVGEFLMLIPAFLSLS